MTDICEPDAMVVLDDDGSIGESELLNDARDTDDAGGTLTKEDVDEPELPSFTPFRLTSESQAI